MKRRAVLLFAGLVAGAGLAAAWAFDPRPLPFGPGLYVFHKDGSLQHVPNYGGPCDELLINLTERGADVRSCE